MKGPGSKMVLRLGVLGSIIEIHRKILKNLLLQNHLAQMLDIWYVALPSSLLPSFVQMKVPGSKMAPRQGALGSNHRNI